MLISQRRTINFRGFFEKTEAGLVPVRAQFYYTRRSSPHARFTCPVPNLSTQPICCCRHMSCDQPGFALHAKAYASIEADSVMDLRNDSRRGTWYNHFKMLPMLASTTAVCGWFPGKTLCWMSRAILRQSRAFACLPRLCKTIPSSEKEEAVSTLSMPKTFFKILFAVLWHL